MSAWLFFGILAPIGIGVMVLHVLNKIDDDEFEAFWREHRR